MADYITENSTLQSYEVLTDVELKRLSTTRLDAENIPWETRHKLAWKKTLDRLAQRNPPIAEADISDTDPLLLAVCYYVAYLAYRWAPGGENDLKRAEWWYAQWERELEEVRISDEIGPGEWQFQRSYRA